MKGTEWFIGSGWGSVWLSPSDVTWWPELLMMAVVAVLSGARWVLRDWQEHLKVQMILREAPRGTIVATQSRRGRAATTVVVQVGHLDGASVTRPLPDGRAK
jgi:hypothetical protein